MKKNLFIWQVIGATFTAVLGTILHFLFEWTGFNIFATFSAVNESTWEHMKLVFIPSLIFATIQYFIAKDEYDSFWLIKLIGILFGTLLIPILFYTLSGIFGNLSAITNIAIFFVSVFSEYLLEYFLFKKDFIKAKLKWFSIGILLFILSLFIIFSFFPPKIPLYLDPVTRSYGIIN